MAHVELDERKAIREIEKDMGRRLESLGRPSVRLARENTPIDTGQSAASVEYEVDRSNLTLRFGSVLHYNPSVHHFYSICVGGGAKSQCAMSCPASQPLARATRGSPAIGEPAPGLHCACVAHRSNAASCASSSASCANSSTDADAQGAEKT